MKMYQFMYEMQKTANILSRTTGVRVVFKGNQAMTDGETITLPAIPLNQELTTDFVRKLRGLVDHEGSGHLGNSDMPRILEFYDRNNYNGRETLTHLHNCLEDIFIEHRVIQEYPGSRKNLTAVADQIISPSVTESLKTVDYSKMSFESVAGAIISVGRAPYAGEKLRELLDSGFVGEDLLPHIEHWCSLARNAKNTKEVIELAKTIWLMLQEDNPESKLPQNPEDLDTQPGKDMDEGENSPEYRETENQGKAAKEVKKLLKEGKDKLGEEGQSVLADLLNTDFSEKLTGSNGAVDNPFSGSGTNTRTEGEDWVGPYRVYSTDKDVVYKRGKPLDSYGLKGVQELLDSPDITPYETTKSKLSSEIAQLKNKLRKSLLSMQYRGWKRYQEDGKLDSRRYSAAFQGDKSVRKKRTDRVEMNTAVTLLVDLSGSMYGHKVEVARQSIISLAEALENTGVTYSIVGFTNKRDCDIYSSDYSRVEPLDTIIFKDFDQSLRQCRGAIGHITQQAGGNNTDYDFIVNAIQSLYSRTENRKILITLSDGYPAGYSSFSTHSMAAQCKQAVEEGKKKYGVECVGIGIKSDAVKEIYKDHVVINNVSDLSGTLLRKFSKMILDSGKKVKGRK